MFTGNRSIKMELGVILIAGLYLMGLGSGFAGENRAMAGGN